MRVYACGFVWVCVCVCRFCITYLCVCLCVGTIVCVCARVRWGILLSDREMRLAGREGEKKRKKVAENDPVCARPGVVAAAAKIYNPAVGALASANKTPGPGNRRGPPGRANRSRGLSPANEFGFNCFKRSLWKPRNWTAIIKLLIVIVINFSGPSLILPLGIRSWLLRAPAPRRRRANRARTTITLFAERARSERASRSHLRRSAPGEVICLTCSPRTF